MVARKSYSVVTPQKEPTTFSGKYGLRNQADLDKVGREAFVIPIDITNGYVEIPYHTVRVASNGKGFNDASYNIKVACHKYDKETGDVVDNAPLCCVLAQKEKDRIPEKEKSGRRALSFQSTRIIIPVMVLSSIETDKDKKSSLKKISIKNGVNFSYIDLSESAFKDLNKGIVDAMETEGIIDSPEDLSDEELNETAVKYLANSVIKITNVEGRTKDIKYEKTYRVIPISNQQVAKESNEQKVISHVAKLANNMFPKEKLPDLFAKYPEIQDINNQIIEYLELFNNEVSSIVNDWTDEQLQAYYNSYVEQQTVVDTYKTQTDTPAETTTLEFDDFEGGSDSSTNTSVDEEEFDFSSSDLEESSILDDTDFNEDDFELDEDEDL